METMFGPDTEEGEGYPYHAVRERVKRVWGYLDTPLALRPLPLLQARLKDEIESARAAFDGLDDESSNVESKKARSRGGGGRVVAWDLHEFAPDVPFLPSSTTVLGGGGGGGLAEGGRGSAGMGRVGSVAGIADHDRLSGRGRALSISSLASRVGVAAE